MARVLKSALHKPKEADNQVTVSFRIPEDWYQFLKGLQPVELVNGRQSPLSHFMRAAFWDYLKIKGFAGDL